jgi:hypothetical protein
MFMKVFTSTVTFGHSNHGPRGIFPILANILYHLQIDHTFTLLKPGFKAEEILRPDLYILNDTSMRTPIKTPNLS